MTTEQAPSELTDEQLRNVWRETAPGQMPLTFLAHWPGLKAFARAVIAADRAMVASQSSSEFPPLPEMGATFLDDWGPEVKVGFTADQMRDYALAALVASQAQPAAEPVAWAETVEDRLNTWRQRHRNRSGDCLALDDFMSYDARSDLIDFVCAPLAATQTEGTSK